MEYKEDQLKILSTILDIGAEMIRSGAETHRVEDSLYRLASAYHFSAPNFWVVPTNIQATVTSKDGQCLTQIRHVRNAGIKFDRLDSLNDLSRKVCHNPVGADEFERLFHLILEKPVQPLWKSIIAGILSGAAFGVFFNCNVLDTVAAAAASLVITFSRKALMPQENNPLILNFLISVITELVILLCVFNRIGQHTGAITTGVIMLLISGLGVTNGIRDLVHLDTFSGLVNLTASFTGAVGIALGIALPLFLLNAPGKMELAGLNPNRLVALSAAMVACFGFSVWMDVRGWKTVVCGLGGLLSWWVFLLLDSHGSGIFLCSLAASAACAAYAQIMARVFKAPATIFVTVSLFPLIPGADLYRMMYGLVIGDYSLARDCGSSMLLTCFGIVLGIMIIETLEKALNHRCKP